MIIEFIEAPMTIPEMEEEKWYAMQENTLQGSFYALYLQYMIDQSIIEKQKA